MIQLSFPLKMLTVTWIGLMPTLRSSIVPLQGWPCIRIYIHLKLLRWLSSAQMIYLLLIIYIYKFKTS